MKFAIELNNVSKSWPGVKALTDISFQVKKGTIHGFLGPNGAGKSTTMNIISGLIKPSAGQVKILGQNIEQLKKKNEKKLIGFLPENPPLYLSMKVRDYLQFVAKINMVGGTSDLQIKKAVHTIMEKCSLHKVADRLIGNLSKGFKQRVAISSALVFEPEIVILDEPTVGLDPASIIEIRELVLSLTENHTVLLSTHILHEVSLLCSEMTIINNGKILRSGPIEEIQKTFQVGRVLKSEVLNWSEDKVNIFYNKFNLDSINVLKKEESTELTFNFKGMEDMRSELSSDLIALNCGLLTFSEEKMDVENIFNKITEVESCKREPHL